MAESVSSEDAAAAVLKDDTSNDRSADTEISPSSESFQYSPAPVSRYEQDMIPEISLSADVKTGGYAVQLAAFAAHENINLDQFTAVNNLVLAKGDDGYTRLFSGIFQDRTRADAHLKNLYIQGYRGFIRELRYHL